MKIIVIFARMALSIYYPFTSFNFSNRNCFLTGQPLQSEEEKINVFPTWLMSRYNLADQLFKLLDESFTTYKDLKIPCASAVNEQYIESLEADVAKAFDKGYDAVKQLDDFKIFKWAGKLLYGIIFKELQTGIKQQHAVGEEFSMSQAIIHKFSHLHLMLQSLNLPVSFDGFKPFSLFLFKVNNAENEFSYRDEINTLTFSLRIKDFGLIICLQDNGANYRFNEETFNKIGGAALHPIQFEEFCAKVFYSAYLFNRLPEYDVYTIADEISIEAMPLRGTSTKPLFDDWQFKTYGQVLENFWKKWGFLLLEIVKKPEQPMSFLMDTRGNFIPAEKINLPL